MRRIALVAVAVAVCSFTALAGPKEEAEGVAVEFINAYLAGDLERTTALFSTDALFWGTVSPELGTSPEVVRKYFADDYAARANAPLTLVAITDPSALVLSDDTVVIAAVWQTNSSNARSFLRLTMVVHKKGGQWRIAHLHSSPRPKQ
jgi:uncharacterized protein (TIGR02246 family)